MEVVLGGSVVATLSMSDIRLLPQVTIEAEGQRQTGPTLRSVLATSGVEAFERVTVSGMRPGRLVSAELTMTSTEVTDEVLLTFNRRGRTKLASPFIPSERSIIDVTRLAVK